MSWMAKGSLLIPAPAPKKGEEDLKGGVTITLEAIHTKSNKQLRGLLRLELMALEDEMMEEIRRIKKEAKRA